MEVEVGVGVGVESRKKLKRKWKLISQCLVSPSHGLTRYSTYFTACTVIPGTGRHCLYTAISYYISIPVYC